jgi:hypothetical protein
MNALNEFLVGHDLKFLSHKVHAQLCAQLVQRLLKSFYLSHSQLYLAHAYLILENNPCLTRFESKLILLNKISLCQLSYLLGDMIHPYSGLNKPNSDCTYLSS